MPRGMSGVRHGGLRPPSSSRELFLFPAAPTQRLTHFTLGANFPVPLALLRALVRMRTCTIRLLAKVTAFCREGEEKRQGCVWTPWGGGVMVEGPGEGGGREAASLRSPPARG